MLAAIVTAVVSLPTQTLIHELSHAIIPKLKGSTIKIRIIPSIVDKKLLWGLTTFNATMTKFELGMTYMMPRIIDLIIIAVLFPITLLPINPVLCTVLKVWQLAATADFSYNTIGIFAAENSFSDSWMTVHTLFANTNIRIVRMLSILAIIAAIVAATHNILW